MEIKFSFRNPIVIFFISYLASYLLFFFIPTFCISDSMYFIQGIPKGKEIGMDFFATIKMALDENMIPYSPLSKIIFTLISKNQITNNFLFITILTLIATIGSFILLYKLLKVNNLSILIICFLIYINSYGFQFEIERGQWNIISIFFVIVAVYLSKKNNNILSALFFALAVSLKLYPILFAPALIKDYSKIRDVIKTIFYTIVANVVFFMILGFSNLKWFYRIISKYADIKTSWIGNHSMTSFSIIYGNEWIKPVVIALFLFLIGFFLYEFIKKDSEKPMAHFFSVLALSSCIFPSVSHDYKLSILGLFMPFVFSKYKDISLISGIILLLFSFLYFSIQYSYEGFYYFKIYLLESKFLMLLLLCVCIFIDYTYQKREPA